MISSSELEEYVDSTAGDLASFLKARLFKPEKIARTQEVYRHFCLYTGKRIEDMSSQDYTVYHKLHATTPENDADYYEILGGLREYGAFRRGDLTRSEAAESLNNATPAPNRLRRTAKTCRFDPTQEVLAALFASHSDESQTGDGDGAKEDRNSITRDRRIWPEGRIQNEFDGRGIGAEDVRTGYSPSSEKKGPALLSSNIRGVRANSADLRGSYISSSDVRGSRVKSSDALGNRASCDYDTPKPLQPVEAPLSNGALSNESTRRPSLAAVLRDIPKSSESKTGSMPLLSEPSSGTDNARNRADSIHDAFAQFDFSMDESLASVIRDPSDSGVPHLQRRRISSGTLSDTRSGMAGGAIHPGVRSTPSAMDMAGVQSSETVAGDMSNQFHSAPNNAAESGELLRGVEGIEYDFSEQNLSGLKSIPSSSSNKTISPLAFRSWVFDGGYTVDIPLPKPEEMQPVHPGFVSRYLLPLAPFILLLILGLAVLTVYIPVAIGLLCFAAIALIIARTDVCRPDQRTVQAAVTHMINAKNGRCYSQGYALLAYPKDGDTPNLSAVWEDAPSMTKAILSRFHTIDCNTRMISGSDEEKSALVLYTSSTEYCIIPLVRLDDLWYVTDAEFKMHPLPDSE